MTLVSLLIHGDQKSYNIWCRSSAFNLMNVKETKKKSNQIECENTQFDINKKTLNQLI
jgi:hypothetical protein